MTGEAVNLPTPRECAERAHDELTRPHVEQRTGHGLVTFPPLPEQTQRARAWLSLGHLMLALEYQEQDL